jgi:hypothetical protein
VAFALHATVSRSIHWALALDRSVSGAPPTVGSR